MRLLQYNTWNHHKNQHGIERMTRALDIEYVKSTDPSVCAEEWDIVFVPSEYVPPDHFPHAKKIIYGPHNLVHEGKWSTLRHADSPKVYYNLLSPWCKEMMNEMIQFNTCFNVVCLPFAVDVDAFCPPLDKSVERDCFIYFKHRNPSHLQTAISLCNALGLTYEVISYGSYSEERYKQLLNTSKFGIWVGSHESQGFALEEALSKNVPLVVWNVESVFDEMMMNGYMPWGHFKGIYSLKATSAPYWDERCGILCDGSTFRNSVKQMLETYQTFRPREYILDVLSSEVCMKRWLDL